MRIGLHSPVPPARTGVADYAVQLARALSVHAEVVLNPQTPAGVELYQMGNNQLHAAILERALRHPGAVVFHDALLHHLYLGSLERDAYIQEFAYNYGEWSRDQAERLWAERARSAQDARYFDYPMLGRLAKASQVVIVHNPAAAERVRRHAPDARVFQIPHLFAAPEPVPEPEIALLRASLGVGEGQTLFGVFGHLRESKRLPTLLRAFHQVRSQHPGARLLVAGAFASPELEQAVEDLLTAEGVLYRPYLAEGDFWCHAQAVDVCCNLKFPSAGETSGIGVRMMGIGRPVIFTDGPEIADYGEDICIRVDAGPAEQEMLEHYMEWCVSEPGMAYRIGEHARRHILRLHAPARCAELYLAALAACEAPA